MGELNVMYHAYIAAMYFTEVDIDIDDGVSLENVGLTEECKQKVWDDCEKFLGAIRRWGRDFIDWEGMDWDQLGHDFWLERNDHACGFDEHAHLYDDQETAQWLAVLARAMGPHEAEFKGDVHTPAVRRLERHAAGV